MALNLTYYDCKVRLVEDLLGTVPKDREVYARYIQAKAREQMEKDAKKGVALASGEDANGETITQVLEAEPETIAEVEERGWTGFHCDEEGPFLFDYACKGFLKESARTLKQWGNEEDGGKVVKQLQDKVSRYVFVKPRKIRLPPVEGVLERPLRELSAPVA